MQAAIIALIDASEQCAKPYSTQCARAAEFLRAALTQQERTKPAAWIDNSGHPRHISYVQSATERRLYGPLRPLYEVAPKQEQSEPVAWMDVVGFEGKYQVSNQGEIVNTKTGSTLSLESVAGDGYVKATLWKDGARTQTYVHRVVAEAFLGPSNGREVNHKNGDKKDNRAANLEWCSRAENMNHSYYVLGKRVRAVVATNTQTGEQRTYPSVEEAVRAGFDSSKIYGCLRGERKSHAGYFWADTFPPPRKPLTDEQIDRIAGYGKIKATDNVHRTFARAIERAHGIGDEHE
jgi:hypothetical protein